MKSVSLLSCCLGLSAAVAQAGIVLPESPNQAERYAAEELRYHLEKATGRSDWPVEFHVGRTDGLKASGLKADFALDAFAVDGVGGRVYLRGGDRDGSAVGNSWTAACQGTLYAVYEFLERKLGVKWIWPGESGEVIPHCASLAFGDFHLEGTTPLVMRTWRCNSTGKAPYWAGGPEVARQFDANQRKFLVRHRQGSSQCFNAGHNFSDWWKRFGKSHPEYFAMLCNGKREMMKGDERGEFAPMCLSEPGYWTRIVDEWIKSPERKPGNVPYRPYLNLCQNDSPIMCTCPRCRAWDWPDPRFATTPYWQGQDPLTRLGRFYRVSKADWGEEGSSVAKLDPPSVSDRAAKFYNAVLAEAKRRVPGARAVGYAYANYLDAPKETKVDPDLYLMFVPECYFPYDRETSETYRRQWLGWKKAGVKDFAYRPNYTLSGSDFPINRGRVILDDFAFAFTNGMFGCYFDSLIGSWGAHAPMNYALMRAIREPLVGYERTLAEFCSAFGAAAEKVRAYADYVEAHDETVSTRRFASICRANPTVGGSQGGGTGNFNLVAADVFTDEWFRGADRILADAASLVRDDAASAARVAFLRKGLKAAALCYRTRVAQKSGDKEAFAAAFAKLVAYRASVERDGIADFGWLATCEKQNAGWPHKK